MQLMGRFFFDDALEISELHYSGNIDRMVESLYLAARFNYALATQR